MIFPSATPVRSPCLAYVSLPISSCPHHLGGLPLRLFFHLECSGLQSSILPASTCPTPSRLPTSCPRSSHRAPRRVASCHVAARPHFTSAWLTVLVEAQGQAAGKSRIAPRFLHPRPPGHLHHLPSDFFPASPARATLPTRGQEPPTIAHTVIFTTGAFDGGWLQGEERGPRCKSSSDSASKGTTQSPRGRAGNRSLGGLARELPSHI